MLQALKIMIQIAINLVQMVNVCNVQEVSILIQIVNVHKSIHFVLVSIQKPLDV